MNSDQETHVVIIGAYGSAGVSVAEGLLDAPNIKLTLIDDGEPGGGLCILRGCMPSKEVLSAAAHRYQARSDHRVDGNTPTVDLDAVYATKQDHVLGFAEHRRAAVHAMAERDHVTFLHDTAHLTGPQTVAINDREIKADYIVVATGSTVNVPDLPGMNDVEYMTSADVLDATEFPETGVVMGFGYVGLELVPYLSEAAGMDITVIEHDERPLDEADPTYGETILDIYRNEFDVEILTNTDERSVAPSDDGGVELTVEREWGLEILEADQLFLFTGRRPNIDGLGVDNAGLHVPCDIEDTLQAKENDRVFVVGDANGIEPILHVAKEQGSQAAENILSHRNGESLDPYETIPHHVVFTGLGVYPYARVGQTAAMATNSDRSVTVVRRDASDDGVFKTKNAAFGHASLVVDSNDGGVLGYQGLHHHADVMAKTMQVIIELGIDVRDLPDRAFHPTTPEILDGLFREASTAIE